MDFQAEIDKEMNAKLVALEAEIERLRAQNKRLKAAYVRLAERIPMSLRAALGEGKK